MKQLIVALETVFLPNDVSAFVQIAYWHSMFSLLAGLIKYHVEEVDKLNYFEPRARLPLTRFVCSF